MKTLIKLRRFTVWACIFFQLISFAIIGAPSASAQAGTREVTVGKPSIWSFAQAHYLLSSLRERSQAIETQPLSSKDLDANAVNRSRIDMLRTIFGAEAELDQAKGTQNTLKLKQHERNVERANNLQSMADESRSRLLDVVREITTLESKRARLNSELPSPVPEKPPQEIADKLKDIKKLDKLIEVRRAEKEALNAEVGVINQQLKDIDTSLSATAFQGVLTNDSAAKQPTGLLTRADIQAILGSNNSPKLNASTAIDNYIQLQYELIAKQLTLLRDEVGPNQRIVFLELPCSIYMGPKNAEKSLAQVRWKITKYVKEDDTAEAQPKAVTYKQAREKAWQNANSDDGSFQVIDIIPRQSALNVSEVHNTVSGFNIGAKLVWLFGLGAKVNYERQREVYDQFLYQEMFASGFGKGEEEFGWTFGPLPGTSRIAPGIRTTYAVVSIPREATAIEVQGRGFTFPRKEDPAKNTAASAASSFTLLIPREGNGFDLSSIDYVPVESGNRITAILRGRYFSPQIGILVNGVPLRRVIEIATTLKPAAQAANGAASNPANVIEGQFEYVSSETIVLGWKMPDSYEGTPIITLITPEYTSRINDLPLIINDAKTEQHLAVRGQTEPMFFKNLDITNIVIQSISADDVVTAKLQGQGFKPGAEISANGAKVFTEQESPQSYIISFKKQGATTWHVEIRQKIHQKIEEDSHTLSQGDSGIMYEISDFHSSTSQNNNKKFKVVFKIGSFFNTSGFNVKPVTPGQAKITNGGPEDIGISKRIETAANPLKLQIINREGRIFQNVTLYLPLNPQITTIVNESNGKGGAAEGGPEGRYRVRIIGENFGPVKEVKFGATRVDIEEQTNNLIIVQAPPGQGKVFVTLKTGPILEGKYLFNVEDFERGTGFFEYKSPSNTQAGRENGGQTGKETAVNNQ